MFERIERAPFQVALFIQDQPVKPHRPIPDWRKKTMRGADRSPHSRVCCLLYVTDESENFHSVRAEVRGKLVLDRFADRLEAALVDVLHHLDAHFLEL